MDSLYFIGKAQFYQLATHISLYHEDSSPAYRHVADECLRAVGLRPERFTFWNVPMMSGYLGKAIPLDIHGGYVLVDEEKVLPMAKSYGVLRYAFLSSAVRARQGGRWRYDFMTMNATLGIGVVAGFLTLSFGRKRVGFFRRRPVGAVVTSFGVCFLTTLISRQVIKGLGLGVVQAQGSHKKALTCLQCVDCLEDVNTYTRNQVAELQAQTIPQQPGMPPPPEEYVKRFQKNKDLQCKLLETDMDEVRLIRKYMGPKLCEVHKGLRADPQHYREEHGLLLLPADRAAAQERPALPES
ncbi:hypothetical protein STCU_05693 [Strigomonas culicis]|nr:hypothetical protein STCU_08285 [Strigomonas culicis]EPY27553.1 hypothetical protein STCU_05693 [Strigomonas culicis]|eukprot:EPY22239.1 hypothetical protein STCU_08285 [Strigomonas culicis]